MQWQKSVADDGFLDQVVDRWRASGMGYDAEEAQQSSMLAEAIQVDADANHVDQRDPEPPRRAPPAALRAAPAPAKTARAPSAQGLRSSSSLLKRDSNAAANAPRPSILKRDVAPGTGNPATPPLVSEAQRAALRERLLKPQTQR